ncbi:MAG: PorV/PorQ family protein [Candidatus Marinimicrobia bacterium]|nr:PorV/PorQ family protein [Candidatus Neomarinimicrobiota bacterium]
MKLKYILLLFCAIAQLWAVGEAGAIFLLIAPGAGPQGSGEAQVAKADDAYASYYNPAGLGFLKGTEVAGMHVNWLPNLASDLYYEFITYRHHIEGLGSLGGHIIYLNLGEQIGMDEFGNPTDNWKSYMGAIAGSFGTHLSESSAIGFNFKVFHQKLSDQVVAGEEGKGYSTDFGFDIGYLKKFKQSNSALKSKKKKKLNGLFDQLTDIYDRQIKLNDEISAIFETENNGYEEIEEQRYLREDLEGLRSKLFKYDSMENFSEFDVRLVSIVEDMNQLINSFDELQGEEIIPATVENFEDSTNIILDNLLFELLDVESIRENFITEAESEDIQDLDDKFNFGFSISNIGPKIDFVDVDQADPSPTNMRLGIFAQLYNDGFNKVNFLFDANKLLVTRYQMMDWDGDGIVGGYDESGIAVSNSGFISGDYNSKGRKEYDDLGSFDDPWYLAIVTAWLDDWLLGGDIDHSSDQKIGGYTCTGEIKDSSLGEYGCENGVWNPTDDLAFSDSDYGIYGKPIDGVENDDGTIEGGNAQIEKGSGDNRSITKELEEMVYNVGMEYWYTDAFALRAGYIYDFEGKIFNPTFGAGIRLLQYGFDFGYTAGEQGHPRANTMFFSVNIKL